MNRQSSGGGARKELQSVTAGDTPTKTFGKTGIQVSLIAQGGARMEIHPDVQAAAAHVRMVYDLGVTYFDRTRSYGTGDPKKRTASPCRASGTTSFSRQGLLSTLSHTLGDVPERRFWRLRL